MKKVKMSTIYGIMMKRDKKEDGIKNYNNLLFNRKQNDIQEFKVNLNKKVNKRFAFNKLGEICDALDIDYTFISLKDYILLTIKSENLKLLDSFKLLFNEFAISVERI